MHSFPSLLCSGGLQVLQCCNLEPVPARNTQYGCRLCPHDDLQLNTGSLILPWVTLLFPSHTWQHDTSDFKGQGSGWYSKLHKFECLIKAHSPYASKWYKKTAPKPCWLQLCWLCLHSFLYAFTSHVNKSCLSVGLYLRLFLEFPPVMGREPGPSQSCGHTATWGRGCTIWLYQMPLTCTS